MPFNSGIITGMLGYSLKKEMMGDSMFVRETERYTYEIYSLSLNNSPTAIQRNIYSEFASKYSGNIYVKVFSQPAEYNFPNNSVNVSKFNVEVEIKSNPTGLRNWSSELTSTSGYKGLDENFFFTSGKTILDLKESFDFATQADGLQTFSHGISFGLITGNKNLATAIAASIYGRDKDNSFGISTMIGDIVTIANSGTYQNYYTETYDIIHNTYSFNRKRDVLPSGAATYTYNTIHNLELKQDGIVEIVEKGNIRGKMSFNESLQGFETMTGTSYSRCNSIYNTYAPLSTNLAFSLSTTPLVNSALRVTKIHNRPALSTDYEIAYTNDPQYSVSGAYIEDSINVEDSDLGIVSLKHSINMSINKRTSPINFTTLLNNAVNSSPVKVSGYFTPAIWPLKNIKKSITWPNRKSKECKVELEYSNNPKYFVTINGISYRMLEYKITRQEPIDKISEYKIINRPLKTSVLSYAYQTEKLEMTVTINAGISRTPDEFTTSFRTDIGGYVANLYNYSISLFFNDFVGQFPLAFTYYVKDVKYSYDSDNGVLQMITVFAYSMKKYTP